MEATLDSQLDENLIMETHVSDVPAQGDRAHEQDRAHDQDRADDRDRAEADRSSGNSLGLILAQVGPRLRYLRQDRGGTLADLAAATGISVSTLSRLESGQRRPSLELLLPIARAYQVPLDELVAEVEVEDPRVQIPPTRRGGLTIQPLSGHPGGLQVFRMTVPPSLSTPQPQGHDGRDWVHVLQGRLHLVLSGRDLVLEPGDAAEFDGRLPHWFGSTGDEPVEFLTILDAAGERQHLRGRARREQQQTD